MAAWNMMTVVSKKQNIVFLLISLILSSFTHLWNPTGFPDLFFDEGIYMRRAMHMIESGNPQEAYFHDHPFFGQIFLAALLEISGFPDSLNPSSDVQSMELLYMIPRVWMGILAVVDTFLIFKISEKRYNRRVAIISSVLFAVMPITWFVRRILLDSILLPFFLSSVLFALYVKRPENKMIHFMPILLSGVFLGLAIFTKIPAFTMIPIIGFLVYSNSGKKIQNLGIWLVPVILIPLIWPAQSVIAGQFDTWIKDVLWQTSRDSEGLAVIFWNFLIMDPALLIMGLAGLGYSAIKKDAFVLLWIFPLLVFLSLIGYVQYFHSIPIIPAFCTTAALLIDGILCRIKNVNVTRVLEKAIVFSLAIFGFASTTLLITTDVTSSQFEAAAFALEKMDGNTTMIASPTYTWMYIYVYDKEHTFLDYLDVIYYPIQTSKIILISDNHFENDIGTDNKLKEINEKTDTIMTFKGTVLNYNLAQYPYTSMNKNYEGSIIAVKQ